MTTGVLGTNARQDPRQVTNTLKKIVNYNDPGISSGVAFDNPLPQNAFITQVDVEVVAAFNGTTNTLTVGTVATDYNNIVASADLVGNGSSSLGTQVVEVTRGKGRGLTASADTSVYAKYASTGTPTTGQAIIVIQFEGGWTS